MTQLLVSIKTDASVSFIGQMFLSWSIIEFLKYTLHKIYAKSQYLQCCWTYFYKSSYIGLLSINLSDWCLEFLRVCRVFFVNLPLNYWPQVINRIKVTGVPWPWTQNLDVFSLNPLIFPHLTWITCTLCTEWSKLGIKPRIFSQTMTNSELSFCPIWLQR